MGWRVSQSRKALYFVCLCVCLFAYLLLVGVSFFLEGEVVLRGWGGREGRLF